MSRPNTKALAALQAKLAAVEQARDQGRDYFKKYPELLLVEVSREGSKRFDSSEHVIAFLQGYSAARIRHDEYQRGE